MRQSKAWVGIAVMAGLAGGAGEARSTPNSDARTFPTKVAPKLPPTRGPLRVSSRNPRYFEDRTGKIVYLTGSHTWTNLQDITGEDWMKPISEKGGYSAYLDRLARYPHNFFRLWIVEHAWDASTGARISPHPWMRTGPGNARDGKPKFDLDRLNPEYFKRMRERVAEARKRGIYVGIMFFDDWSTENGGAWEGHPFHRDNNVNGVDADLNRDGLGVEFHTLKDKRILAYQEAYVRRAMEAVNGLDNVLYEVANETTVLGSKVWQYHFIRFIKEAQAKKRMRHPVGMTVADTEVNNAALFSSAAEWISPGTEGGYQDDPPAADGRKVIVSDTDHLWGVGGDADWVWKSFLRGMNPIYMDPMFGESKHEAVRRAMGHTWRTAAKLNLAAMTPQPDLASTRYCLADPGKAYLIYQPGEGAFTVRLPEGAYEAEWFDPEAEVTRTGVRVKSVGGTETMTPPFAGRAVLSLKRAGQLKVIRMASAVAGTTEVNSILRSSRAAAGMPPAKPSYKRTPTRGPLRVSPRNPRYFEDRTGKIVYLTGSHTWTNLIDRGPSDPPSAFDYDGYLDFLENHHHSFIRLWSRHLSRYQQEYGEKELRASPLPWRRNGPDKALDGKPKFDLTKFNPAYFDRLRSRIRAARDRGIYVSIMLFGGYQEVGPNWTGNPFHRDNNISGVDGDPNRDGRGSETQTLSEIPESVAKIQKDYVRKVIDTVNDLDNVLFEICNECEGASQDWQYDLIRFIHRYERKKAMQHPVGMTMADWSPRETRARLDASPAEWVSYYFQMEPPQGQEGFSIHDPFVADGRKVSVMDSDHWWVVPIYGNAEFGRDWVWKSFCRGHNPILMEHLPPQSLVMAEVPLTTDDPGYVASRNAMGQTQRMADRMNLETMTPQPDLASTRYCLADPGKAYLIYQPGEGAFTVRLLEGTYDAEWFDPEADTSRTGKRVKSAGEMETMTPPFAGRAVLSLKRIGHR